MIPQTRTLIDGIIKARQLLRQDGAPSDSLSIRLHPSDYMTLGLEASIGGIIHIDTANSSLTVSGMPSVQDRDVAIGAPVVEQAIDALDREP